MLDWLFGGELDRATLEATSAILGSMGIIEAEFENGVLRPLRPLTLRPGERVGIVVVRRPDPARWDLERLSKAAAADEEKLPEEGLGDWADALDREDRRCS